MIDRIRSALGARRFAVGTEEELQEAIARVLDAEGIPYVREHRLSERDRLDFAFPGDDGNKLVALEVKVDGSLADLRRQLHRYAGDERIDELAVVVNRSRLLDLPSKLRGKPVHVISLLGSALL